MVRINLGPMAQASRWVLVKGGSDMALDAVQEKICSAPHFVIINYAIYQRVLDDCHVVWAMFVTCHMQTSHVGERLGSMIDHFASIFKNLGVNTWHKLSNYGVATKVNVTLSYS